MTIGISKEKLIEIIEDWSTNDRAKVYDKIISQCTELNPWNPIESAPKDIRLLLWHEPSEQILTGNSDFPNCTKWQELPADPK